MKLWKGATFAFVLCGAALTIVLVRNTAELTLQTRPPPSESSLTEAKAPVGALRRRVRSTGNNMNSLLSEFSMMFQSFTESELQHVVGNLLDRKRRRSQPPLHHSQASRTKRARKPRPCDLRKLVLKVSELGLGYESDEEMVLKYCSGRCTAHRQNYDLTMRHMVQTAFQNRRRDKVSSGPCCRPTAFEEALTFLDNRSRYHIIQNVSAKNCGCV
ncbi:neurturin [Oryzias melastigma]|nr:neurturin [Oryzias melastigma]